MPKKVSLKGLITLLCIGGFTIIAAAVTQNALLPFDLRIQQAVFSLRSELLSDLLIPLTRSGNWQCVALICAALLVIPKTRKQYGFPLVCSALFSVSIYEILKYIFQRPRPDIALHLIHEGGFSFPSGHSLTSLVVWGTLLLLIRAYARIPETQWEETCDAPRLTGAVSVNIITGILAAYIVLMGASRVYVGVHFPTDVIASWCLGICILIVFYSSFLPVLLPKTEIQTHRF